MLFPRLPVMALQTLAPSRGRRLLPCPEHGQAAAPARTLPWPKILQTWFAGRGLDRFADPGGFSEWPDSAQGGDRGKW